MHAGIAVAAFLATVGIGTIAGAQVFVLIAIVPAFADWTQEMGVRVHQSCLCMRPHRVLRVVGVGTMIATVTFLALAIADRGHAATDVLVAAGLVIFIVSTVLSTREWKINYEIAGWGDHPDYERYSQLRPTWDRQHRIRTPLSILAFALVALGTALLVT